MCNDRSWKTCSIATIVFSSLLMLGMFIGVGVMNAMFANNMRCYRDVNSNHDSNGYVHRREMFEEMHHIAAQHPSGDGVARVKLALSNIAQTFGLGAAMKLPAVLALSPEGRKLTEAIPNDDSCVFSSDGGCDDGGLCSCGTDLSDCGYRFSSDSCGSISPPPPYNSGYIPNDDSCYFSSDGDCDDALVGGLCSCGTDLTDCGYRSSTSDCRAWDYQRGKTADESVEEIEKVRAPPFTSLRVPPCAPPPFPRLPFRGTVPSSRPPFPRCPCAQDVLDVFNPSIIVPAIVCALFFYLGSGLTLCKVSHPPSPLPTM